MDSKQESSLQKGKKRKRTPNTENSEPFPEDAADLPRKYSRTTPSTKKKACFSQTVGQGTIGAQGNRTILEVMKMCSPADVLKSLSLVNRQWMEICSSNELSTELWNTFLEDLYIPVDTSTHPKAVCAAYIRQQQTVTDLCQDHMDVLNKATGVWTSTMLSAPLQLKDYSYAILFDGSLLCCGGKNSVSVEQSYEKRAYKIALNGEISSLEPMITGRVNHGIAAYGRKVLVFGGVGGFGGLGGLGGSLLTIEQYDETSWSELPAKLNERHCDFVPSLYKGQIYLCDSFTRPMEVFNPKSLTVAILATITKPHEFCYAVTGYEGCILTIGSRKVRKWNCETNDSEEIQKPNYDLCGMKKRNVLHGDVLYIITNSCRLMINMKTFRRKYFKSSIYRQLTK